MVGILDAQVGMILEDVCRKALTDRRALRAGSQLIHAAGADTPSTGQPGIIWGALVNPLICFLYAVSGMPQDVHRELRHTMT